MYEEGCRVGSLLCWGCHVERCLAVGVTRFLSVCSIVVDEVLALYAQDLRINDSSGYLWGESECVCVHCHRFNLHLL
jgi:hypothetical protein